MKKLINYYVNEDETIKEAMSVIRGNESRCVIVLNDADKVVGVFTEGDILKAILKNININTPLKEVVKPTFHYINERDIKKALELIKEFGIILIPVIGKDFKLKDVITLSDVLERLELKD